MTHRGTQPSAIQIAVRRGRTIAECRDDRDIARLALGGHRVRRNVRVGDFRSKGCELTCDFRLAATDSTCQANKQHRTLGTSWGSTS